MQNDFQDNVHNHIDLEKKLDKNLPASSINPQELFHCLRTIKRGFKDKRNNECTKFI